MAQRDPVEFSEAPGEETAETSNLRYSDVVLHSTDWTTETIVSQLQRKNIALNPRFQRRDAWDKQRKSQFIESLILGLPIPQIVLAESKKHRGNFIVLDGKQRLLSLLQFWALGEGANNGYRLQGLDVRENLTKKSFDDLKTDPALSEDYNALLNQPIRTVVIKNWPDISFLHLVFLRLNTGSVKLSPQELRQALLPGPFTDFVDDYAIASSGLQGLLGINGPDYRMRDVELLARHLAFRFYFGRYGGRMKAFLDEAFTGLNEDWKLKETELRNAAAAFEEAVVALAAIFPEGVARKPQSRHLNRAILDALVFFAVDPRIRSAMSDNVETVRSRYENMFEDHKFTSAIERDTASIANTVFRLEKWGNALRDATGLSFEVPTIVDARIQFEGFWK